MTIYIEVDGSPVDMTNVCWLARESCGCISGATVGNAHGDKILTADDANHHFNDGLTALMKRDVEDGVEYFPVTIEAYRTQWGDKLAVRCPHTPQWGHVVPVPDGYAWGTPDVLNSRPSRVRHLVRADQLTVMFDETRKKKIGENRWRYDVDYKRTAVALCGYAPKHGVLADAVTDTVTCRKCEGAAAKVTAERPGLDCLL